LEFTNAIITIYRHTRFSAMKSGDKMWRYIRCWLCVWIL